MPWWGIAASCAAGATAAVVIWKTWGIPFYHPQPETLGGMVGVKDQLIGTKVQFVGGRVRGVIDRGAVDATLLEKLRPTANSRVLNLTPGARMQINGHEAEFTPERTRERAKVDK